MNERDLRRARRAGIESRWRRLGLNRKQARAATWRPRSPQGRAAIALGRSLVAASTGPSPDTDDEIRQKEAS